MPDFIESFAIYTWLDQLNTEQIILIVMVPFFLLGFATEWLVYRYKSGNWGAQAKGPFHLKETFINLMLGAGYYLASGLASFLYLAALIVWLWDYRIFDIPINAFTIAAGFIVQEFFYYLYHFTAHKVRWFWAQHVSHHTGTVMNMTTAARQSILVGVVGTWLFFVPAILIGFSPEIIFGSLAINLAYQWFVHTDAIPKLHPIIEWLMNTPSNHRVHHARNEGYIDKNFGGVLMIFDHLFGTYAPELESKKPEYGIIKQIKSHNWWVLNMHEFIDMLRDTMAPGPIKLRIQHLWRNPNWNRPGHNSIHTWEVEQAEARQGLISESSNPSTAARSDAGA